MYLTNRFTSHILRPSGKSTYCNAWRTYWRREDEASRPVCFPCERLWQKAQEPR